MAYHFYVNHVCIDCDMTDVLSGNAKKRHQKAYGDLMYLLTERKSLVEQYFYVPISGKVFRQLCNDLYHEDAIPVCPSADDGVNNDIVHLPYSLGCNFSDEAIKLLFHCFVAHDVFGDLTLEKTKAFFDGSLSVDIKCKKATRFAFIMHHLAIGGCITNQYQKAIGKCGYIIAPGSNEPMTADSMKQAVKRARVYAGGKNLPWERTVKLELERLFKLMSDDTK